MNPILQAPIIAKVIGFNRVPRSEPIKVKSRVYHIADKSIILAVVNEYLFNQNYDSAMLWANNQYFLYEKTESGEGFTTHKVKNHPILVEFGESIMNEFKSKVQPVQIADLYAISVHDLIKMVERGEKEAHYIMLSLKAAEARARSNAKINK